MLPDMLWSVSACCRATYTPQRHLTRSLIVSHESHRQGSNNPPQCST